MTLIDLVLQGPASRPDLPDKLCPVLSHLRTNSKSPQPDQRPCTGDSSGMLSPLRPSRSRSSSTSRSIRSIASKSTGNWIKHLRTRSRATSTSSVISEESRPLKNSDFRLLKGWFDAFEKYNTLITNQVSVNPNFPAGELSKIQETIRKVEDGRFIYDLPEAVFDIALLWCPADNMTREPARGPSWSWAGWSGPVNFPFDPSSCPDVRRPGEADVFFKSKVKSFVLGPESGPERYTIRNRATSLKPIPGSTLRSRIEYPTDSLHLLGKEPPTVECDTLRFSTQKIAASAFKMEQICHDDKQPLLCTGLIDSQDRPCGVLMDYEKNLSAYQNEGGLHYILLSINRRVPATKLGSNRSNISHPSGIPIWRDGAFVKDEEIGDPKDYSKGEWKMYNVMLIQEFEAKTLEDGTFQEAFARRVAVGRIHEDAWTQADGRSEAKIVLR
ncbi:hypothetical protein BU23DRAFT_587492 [Bimuria novae-zelandiae CBS 107.79]|uniref:Uncharacterized protein n=1 Tax=Bimuria novae-zelandiae CBS 107.79 TaxID=1447943 RepID=A0A6A5VKH9_9PLEO|nr:hypothetical protein BU23DRAFT_587492 [Bimuria novae-zelandiae CBS 107.79]